MWIYEAALTAVLLFILSRYFGYLGRNCGRAKPTENEYVLITGCDSGIGHALACHLARSSVKVIATCLHPDGENAQKMVALGVGVVFLDLTEDNLENFHERVEQIVAHGSLYAVVNNAGLCVMGEFDWLTEQQVERIFKVNLGSMRIIRLFMDRIIADRARVINVTSINGQISYPGLSAYCASKFALESFSDALAMELEKFGVRVIKVRPADYAKITQIMSAQEAHTNEMRQNLSATKKLRYGSYFEGYQRLTARMAGQLSVHDFSGLLKCFDDALFAASPQTSYTSGRTLYIVGCRVLQLLPERFHRLILSWAFEKALRDRNIRLPPSPPPADD